MKTRNLTVIVPCYNVSKYIEKCLDSIIKQKVTNLEIILVDDKSKDNTEEVIKKYISRHDKYDIKLIVNEENRGAGYSRNRAIKEAKHEYLGFVDGDDYLEDNYYDKLFTVLEKEKATVAVCDLKIKFNGDPDKDYISPACIGNVNKYNLINNGLAASPCNKIYKKELLLKSPFAEGIMNEDIPAIIGVLANAVKISYTNETYYNYIQHHNSVQNSPLNDKKLNIFKAVEILDERLKDHPSYKKIMDAVIYQQIIMFFIYVPCKEKSFIKRAKFLKKFYKLSKKYKIRQNHLLWHFVDNQGKKHKYYYKALLKLNCNGFSYSTSFLISLYNFLYKLKSKEKTVFPKDLSIDDLVTVAKRQSKMSSELSVTAVIPNYNYEKFMIQRLYSILYQTYKVDEIIILDDCSTDNSRELIDEIIESLKEYVNIRRIFNEKNSGCVFKQWQKALEESKSDYVWIAEADDYCKNNFLKSNMNLVKKDNDIYLSYSDTAFIDKDGHIVLKTIKPEIDILKTKHWDSNFINDGKKEILEYSYLNCTIANVSSVIFKKDDYSDCFEQLVKFKQVGDWFFYLKVMERGKIAFYNKPLNFYRLHGNNVTSTTKKQAHFDEIKKIHEYLDKTIKFNKIQKKNIRDRYKFLKRVWGVK